MAAHEPLDVFADLTLEVEDEIVRVKSAGAQIEVDVPSRHALRALLRAPGIRTRRFQLLRQASQRLRDAGLSAEIRLGGRRIGRLGTYPEAGWVARLLNYSSKPTNGRSVATTRTRSDASPSSGRPLGWVAAAAAVATGLVVAGLWFTRRSDR